MTTTSIPLRTMKNTTLISSFIFLVMIIAGCTSHPKTQPLSDNTKVADMQYTETFQLSTCDKIILEYYNKMSDQPNGIAPLKKASIVAKDSIEKIITLVHALPDEGDMMVKMGDVPILNVTLVYPDKSVFFTYYENSVKTPATSFYSAPPKEEKILFELLMATLNP